MAETAAHLVDHVIPRVPNRQWVLSLPFKLLYRICKAFVEGIEELDAVQLTMMPPYRWRVLLSGEEVEISEGSDGGHPFEMK